MQIWISSLADAPHMVRKHRPSKVVSLLSPYDTFPNFSGFGDANHLKVAIHDIADDIGDWQAPKDSDAERIITFVQDWSPSSTMLIHCWAGISRSTASAFIASCVHNPGTDEEEIAWHIREASPTASPNVRLVAHADALLGRGGRMSRAVAAIGRGEPSGGATPFSIPSSLASSTRTRGIQ